MSQLPDGSSIVGGKEIRISGIDVDTGKVKRTCQVFFFFFFHFAVTSSNVLLSRYLILLWITIDGCFKIKNWLVFKVLVILKLQDNHKALKKYVRKSSPMSKIWKKR